MSDAAAGAAPIDLDACVEAYEDARARGERADLAAFLPAADHPDYLAILCELVRVDLEYGWKDGQPRPLDEYRARFPALFADPARAREVAFEEERLRRQAAEPPAGDGGDIGMSHRPSSRARRREEPEGNWFLSICAGPADEPARTVEAIRQSDPLAADRLISGLRAMPEAGGRFLDFRLRRELGRGAFGRVFLAEQEPMADRPVALKVTADAVGEAHALAQLQHTNVMPIYSVHRAGPLQAVCMPYLGSATLADVIAGLDGGRTLPDSGEGLLSSLGDRKQGTPNPPTTQADGHPGPAATAAGEPLPPPPRPTAQIEHLRRSRYVDAVLWLGARLADGLAHAHERGILHRDLKPANVLFTDGGEPMLLDFNLAADLKPSAHASKAMLGGTLPYMAPEHLLAFQGAAHQPDERSDAYSLGVILFELLTGRHPYELHRGPAEAVLPRMIAERSGPVPTLRDRNRAASPAVEAIVRRCLDPDPDRRYPSARDLAEDLRRQLDNLPLRHTPEPSRRERFAKWARRHPRLTSTTSVVLISAAVVAALATGLVVRQRRYERLEAGDSLLRLGLEVSRIEALLAAPNDLTRPIEEGIALSREAVGRYGAADDPRWTARPLVAALPAGDRARASQLVGQLLGLWATGELRRAEGTQGDERGARLDRAGRLLNRAEATFGPDSAPAALTASRAELARLHGRPQEADRLRATIASARPRSARERLLLLPDRFDRGRDREALALAEEATRLEPFDPAAWLLRGDCLRRLGRPREAVDSYTFAIGLLPEFAWAYFRRGVAALDAKDYARAIADFDRVLALRPGLPEALFNRALARLGRGDPAGTVADLDAVLDHPDAPARALFARARAHDARNQPDRAAADRREGLRRTPRDELSWVTRGLNRLPGDPAGAIADFDAALKLSPRSFEALQNKASALSESLGRTREAVEALDRALAWHPESAPALAGRGVLLARLGRRDDALRDAKACLALDNSADTLYRAACVFALTSRTAPEDRPEALRLLAAATRKDPAWLATMRADPDLNPLRPLAGFRRLVEALAVLSPGRPDSDADRPIPAMSP